MKKNNRISRETKKLHVGYVPKRSEYELRVPLFLSSTNIFPNAQYGKAAFRAVLDGDHEHHLIYQRLNHPNAQILEDTAVEIEPGGYKAAAFLTGMAAIHTTVAALLQPGKILLYSNTVYGGTYCLFEQYYAKQGFKVIPVDTTDLRATEKAIKMAGQDLGIFFMESPANPNMRFSNMRVIAEMVKRWSSAVMVVDNTFMGIFQNPFKISPHIDLVIYSATKFLGGHSSLTGGLVIARWNKGYLIKAIKGLRIVFGNIIDPFSAYQLNNQMATYDLRMRALAENATKIAAYLQQHPKVKEVRHPSLLKSGDVDYPIYTEQCSGPGSVISFYLSKRGQETAFKFLNATTKSGIISLAVSLGCVETLITHPKTTTHSEMSLKDQLASGITDELNRVSIGLESVGDLIQAFEAGFKAI